MALIEFSDFSFRYLGSESLALRRVGLKVEEGEYLVVTGPSGCGKTTLCRAINGLVPHFHHGYMAGRVLVNGLDTREHTVAEMSSIAGLVFQNPADQLVTLNVEKEIAFGPENLGIDPSEIRRRVNDLVDLLDLGSLRDKHPHEMSGGEQQRVAIAAVLALKPKILIADEPTSNLDPASSEMILNLIAKFNREGMTVVLIEHRLDIVSKQASRLILMNDGEIVMDGPPRDVLTDPRCEELGIGVPKATQIYQRLRKRNIELPRVPLSGEELALLVQEVSRH